MKDEIKEILFQLEIVARKHTIEVCEDGSKIETMSASVVDELRLNNYSAKLLLDYITNLQDTLKDKEEYCYGLETQLTNLQEQLHQASLDIQELTEKDIGCPSWCDKLTNLQEENKQLNNELTHKTKQYEFIRHRDNISYYENIIDKAIEYINKLSNEPNVFGHYGIDGNCKKYLLNILNGGEQ